MNDALFKSNESREFSISTSQLFGLTIILKIRNSSGKFLIIVSALFTEISYSEENPPQKIPKFFIDKWLY
jgi:hypothetical protein